MGLTNTSARRGRASIVVLAVAGVAVLAAAVGALAADRFGDVAAGHPHEAGIGWVADVGVTAGCGDGSNYCPTDDVSRDQMATFMHRLSGHARGVAPSVDAATVQGLAPADLRGQRGPQGEAGEDGVVGLEYSYVEDVVTDSVVAVFAPCSSGKVPLGGGGLVDTPGWFLGISSPWYDEDSDTLGWLILAESADGSEQEVGAAAIATCADADADEGDLESQSGTGHGELRELEERYSRARLGDR